MFGFNLINIVWCGNQLEQDKYFEQNDEKI